LYRTESVTKFIVLLLFFVSVTITYLFNDYVCKDMAAQIAISAF